MIETYSVCLYIVVMSIVQVAKLAGLSHATVSRVINDRPGVSEGAAERVHAAMKKLGYTPPARRRGPVPKSRAAIRTGNIAVLMLGTESTPLLAPIAAAAIHAVESELADRGFNMALAKISEEGRLPPAVLKNDVDGLILHGYPPNEAIAGKLRDYPAVWIMSRRTPHGDWGDRVAPDNEAIGRMAAEHLLGMGHQRLAFLRIEDSHRGFRQREDAFVAAANEGDAEVLVLDGTCAAGAEPNQTQVDRAALDRVMRELVDARPRPTALFVPRGRWTFIVYESLRQHGVEPGRDVQVLACDNDPVLQGISPTPTTIDIQPELVGAEAVRQLLRRLEEPDSRSMSRASLLIQPRLIAGSAALSFS